MIRLTIYSLVGSMLILFAPVSLAEGVWRMASDPAPVFPDATSVGDFKIKEARLMMRDPVSGEKREYNHTLLDCCISDVTASGCMVDTEGRRVSGCYFDLEIDLVNDSDSTYKVDILSENPHSLVMLPPDNQGFAKREVKGITVAPNGEETVRLQFDIKSSQCGEDWNIEKSSLKECPHRLLELFDARFIHLYIDGEHTLNQACHRFRYLLDKKEKHPVLQVTKISGSLQGRASRTKGSGLCQ